MINVLFILLSKAVIIDHVIKTKIKLKIKKIKKINKPRWKKIFIS